MANQAVFGETSFNVGDTIRVHYKLIEKETVAGKAKKEKKEEIRERTQVFEGIVISIRGNSPENRMFTVRRICSGNIGVERIFPLSSPWIKKITVKKKAKVRRAKLYYLRRAVGKEREKLKEKEGKFSAAVAAEFSQEQKQEQKKEEKASKEKSPKPSNEQKK